MSELQFSMQWILKRSIIFLFLICTILSIIPTVSTVSGQSDNNLPPVASIYLDPTRHPVLNSVKVLEQVYFIGDNSYDPNPEDNLTYYWDFGDGTFSNKISPTHIYSQIGEYQVTLTVNDSVASTSSSVTIFVFSEGGNEPVASIWLDASRDENGNNLGNVSEVIQFDASRSYDPDGSPLSYEWDFGDGERSGNKIASHSYDEQGIFTVVLSVTDEEKQSSLDSISIRIGEGKSSNGKSSNEEQSDVLGLGVMFLIIVVIVIVLLVLIWMYLGRLKRRTLARPGAGLIDEEPRRVEKPMPKTVPQAPEFSKTEVKATEQKSRKARMDTLARSEAKLKQAMLRKKLQDERKRLDDDMKKELEDMGIEL